MNRMTNGCDRSRPHEKGKDANAARQRGGHKAEELQGAAIFLASDVHTESIALLARRGIGFYREMGTRADRSSRTKVEGGKNLAPVKRRTVARALIGGIVLAMAVSGLSAVAKAVTLADIQSRGSVKIGVLTGTPPMGMVDENGNPSGYDVDVAKLVAKHMNLPVELVPLRPPARIPALQTGQVDFLVATLAPTGERAKTVMFTTPYSAFNMVIVSGPKEKFDGLGQLKNKRIAVNRGSSQEEALRRAEIEGLEIVIYEDDSKAAQALAEGKVDAAALPSTVAAGFLRQVPQAGLQVGFTFFRQGNSMAVLPSDFELHQYLNTAIYLMKLSGELDRIAVKWTGEPLPPTLPSF